VQVADDQLAHIFRTILDWHLVKTGFPGDIQSLAPSLIAATLEVYSAATKQLLPTPAKSHYLFNLRDFARVVQVGGWEAPAVAAMAALET
jgi:dynein heavy chain